MADPEVLSAPGWAALVVADTDGLYPRQAVVAAEWVEDARRRAELLLRLVRAEMGALKSRGYTAEQMADQQAFLLGLKEQLEAIA